MKLVTPEGYEKLTIEHDKLLLEDRPEILEVIQWAAGNGDRSENADYIYGKKRLREIDSRLRFLSKEIKNSRVIDYKNSKSQSIQFGAIVSVEDLETSEILSYKIVGGIETDIKKKMISYNSPIGKALIGKKIGDEVIVKTPIKERILEILDFKF